MAAVKQFGNITRSKGDKRHYRGLELSNRLKVILVSDPMTDKAAAAMNVHIGNMSDPAKLPGLAHFCEHMLFLGTQKFPDEKEYKRFLSQHGGSSNASTSSEHTNYFFDVSSKSLSGALDRFSQFFLSPLFTESATEREVNAVNSEFQKNIPIDTRRIRQVEKSTADQSHDFSKFGSGNRVSLETRPKDQGVSVREGLLAFHNEWYSSNIMTLVVLGTEDLDTLQQMVVDSFSDVQDKEVEVPLWSQGPFNEAQLGTLTHIVPVKDIRKLRLTWGIPDQADMYRSRPAHYLAQWFQTIDFTK